MNFPYQNPNYYFIPDPTFSSSDIDKITVGTQLQTIQYQNRFPQWSQQEAQALLNIRAELDWKFTEIKRNKALWTEISTQMQQKGYNRTPEQCKSKWKNLVNCYKGKSDRKFPFHEEMRSIFSERMERSIHLTKGKMKADDGDEQEEDKRISMKKRKKSACTDVVEVLREFGTKQIEMELRMMESLEAREAERRGKEEEWKKELIAAYEERNAVERRWREREEEKWVREDLKDERRHEMITTILAKIDDFISNTS